ncbi:MAG: acyl-CoA dehydrogenase family protein [Gemmatimonadetes bacterium]|nr:acyl-CoA dehydrogenase family protein [Gemmatimonadota bacterium]HNV76156.1 acyl-CoA dehydrogenase family protein [Gemmatimonadaceae bacterium]MBK6842303.1 acyl-CoA dehydrogenase family protein [Gemmatimonadota bacterium]MBK9407813.1 acyl-CoA dehydrogenase family protein [Gemmatimonadota bacterium]MBK9979166.1 acyl-CoA dehydrogenase family protein [Gemmatimonadota bacterium]
MPNEPTLRAQVRHFVDTVLLPLEHRYLNEPWSAVLPALDAARAEARARGIWAPHLPHDLGGRDLPFLDFAAISEELGRTPIGHYALNCQAPDIGNMELLHRHGSAEQQRQWLAPLARGEIRSCFAMTEPERAGSNPVWMEARAERVGDEYVITGHKWFTSAADGSAFAIVMAVTDPGAPPHQRASQIIVPTDTPGYSLVRNIKVMGDEGEGYATHGEVRFERCRVPVTNRIGDEGAGFALAQERLGPGRIHHCMRWMGICERALDLTCRHAATRELSPGVVLGTKQSVQHMIADSRAEIDAARLLILDTARQIDAHGAKAAREAVSAIKFFAAGVLQRVLDRAIQVHGALGMTDDTPLAYWFRHERAARIYDGADEVHKSVVARRILKGYGVTVRE